MIGIDRDQDALEAASRRLEPYPCRKLFIQSNYADIKSVLEELEISGVDGALLDLGRFFLSVGQRRERLLIYAERPSGYEDEPGRKFYRP